MNHLLRMDGTRTLNRAEAVYQLTIHNVDHALTMGELERLQTSFTRRSKVLCQNMVSHEYIRERHEDISFLLELSVITKRGTIAVGMATLEQTKHMHEGLPVLYLDVLCAHISQHALRASGHAELRPGAGTILLKQIFTFAKDAGFGSLMLSSLPYVINYYKRFGFHLLHPGDKDEAAAVKQDVKKLAGFKFKSDADFDRAYTIGYAMQTSHEISKSNVQTLAARLNELFGSDYHFRVIGGAIEALGADDRKDATMQNSLNLALAEPEKHIGLVEAMMTLRKAKLSAADRRAPSSRHAMERDEEGALAPAALSEGFTMIKDLRPGAAGGGGRGRRRRRKSRKPKSRKRRTTRRRRHARN